MQKNNSQTNELAMIVLYFDQLDYQVLSCFVFCFFFICYYYLLISVKDCIYCTVVTHISRLNNCSWNIRHYVNTLELHYRWDTRRKPIFLASKTLCIAVICTSNTTCNLILSIIYLFQILLSFKVLKINSHSSCINIFFFLNVNMTMKNPTLTPSILNFN